MGKGFKHGAGGNPLNFRVVAYATEDDLKKDNPKENTIGVVTTTEISSWVFSATEPSEPEEGMLWISNGLSSPVAFDALSKNTLQVYPISARQYVTGSWTNVTAKIYQNEEWKNWLTYLIKGGVIDTSIAEFEISGVVDPPENYVNFAASFENKNGKIRLVHPASGRICTYVNEEMIDLTPYSAINLNCLSVGGAGTYVILNVSNQRSFRGDAEAVVSPGIIKLDISSITGKKCINLVFYGWGENEHSLEFDDLWLE